MNIKQINLIQCKIIEKSLKDLKCKKDIFVVPKNIETIQEIKIKIKSSNRKFTKEEINNFLKPR